MIDDFLWPAAFIAAAAPPLVIAVYFLVAARIRIDDETVWTGFGLGACTAFPAVVLAHFLGGIWESQGTVYTNALNRAFLSAAIPEEIFKFVAVLSVCHQQLHILKPRHIFALAVLTSCGFAGLENLLYVFEGEEWGATAILRAISAVPGHAFVGAVMGFCIVCAVRSLQTTTSYMRLPGVAVWWCLALILPIALHGLFDFFLMAVSEILKTVDDTAPDQIDTMVLLFSVTVVFEGVLAHLALVGNCRADSPEQTNSKKPPLPSAPIRWLQVFLSHPIWWGLLGSMCFLVGGAILALLLGAIGAAQIFETVPWKSRGLGYS